MADETEGKVSSLKKKKLEGLQGDKEKDKDKPKPKPKPHKVDLYMMIRDAINHHKHSVLPEFPMRFHLIEPDEGVRLVIVENDNREVKIVSHKALINEMANYTSNVLRKNNVMGYKWDVKKCTDAMEFWKATTAPLTNISMVDWSDAPGLTYSRLPWVRERNPSGDHPTFNELFSRMSNAQAVSEWIGSLFDIKSYRQQYLWLHGKGGDGKGALISFLQRVFQQAFRSKQPPKEQEAHWTAGLLGARLVVFPDCNAYGFPSTGLFKSLTGGDSVDINPKYKDAYTADLNIKYMFSSNEKPSLSSEESDMRRIIYSEIRFPKEVIDEERNAYGDLLWKEGGAFLSTCINNYESYAKGGPIRVDKQGITEWISTVEEPVEEFFHKYFRLSETDYVTPAKMTEIMKHAGIKEYDRRKFLAWMERKHKIWKKSKRLPEGVRGVYEGIKALSFMQIAISDVE